MTLESAISFFIAILIFAITPGPGVFAVIAHAFVNSARGCVTLTLGIAVSDILYLIAACLGLAAIATHWAEAFMVIRFAGAAYLIYLGWKMWTTPLDLNAVNTKTTKTGMALNFLQGFLISASNPKVILFYIAFLPTFMDLTTLDQTDIVLACLLTFAALMLGTMTIAVFAAKAKYWFRSKRTMRQLNGTAGSMMVGAGVFLAFRN